MTLLIKKLLFLFIITSSLNVIMLNIYYLSSFLLVEYNKVELNKHERTEDNRIDRYLFATNILFQPTISYPAVFKPPLISIVHCPSRLSFKDVSANETLNRAPPVLS